MESEIKFFVFFFSFPPTNLLQFFRLKNTNTTILKLIHSSVAPEDESSNIYLIILITETAYIYSIIQLVTQFLHIHFHAIHKFLLGVNLSRQAVIPSKTKKRKGKKKKHKIITRYYVNTSVTELSTARLHSRSSYNNSMKSRSKSDVIIQFQITITQWKADGNEIDTERRIHKLEQLSLPHFSIFRGIFRLSIQLSQTINP